MSSVESTCLCKLEIPKTSVNGDTIFRASEIFYILDSNFRWSNICAEICELACRACIALSNDTPFDVFCGHSVAVGCHATLFSGQPDTFCGILQKALPMFKNRFQAYQ